jgi:hypothetical protein
MALRLVFLACDRERSATLVSQWMGDNYFEFFLALEDTLSRQSRLHL